MGFSGSMLPFRMWNRLVLFINYRPILSMMKHGTKCPFSRITQYPQAHYSKLTHAHTIVNKIQLWREWTDWFDTMIATEMPRPKLQASTICDLKANKIAQIIHLTVQTTVILYYYHSCAICLRIEMRVEVAGGGELWQYDHIHIINRHISETIEAICTSSI